MTLVGSFHYANARNAAPVTEDDARPLGEKILTVYQTNAAEMMAITVTLKKERGVCLDIFLSDEIKNGEGTATEIPNGIQWDFRLSRQDLIAHQSVLNDLESVIFNNRLYPVKNP